jgi:hypothetical protein
VLAALSVAVDARTIAASGLSPSAVQAAIDSASDGDTVVIPNGTATWTSGVSNNGKAIKLQGQSAGGVTIRYAVNGGPAIAIQESARGHVEVSNLHFAATTVNDFTIDVQAGGRAVLIHDNTWTGFASGVVFRTLHGVVWGNTIDAGVGSGAETQFVNQTYLDGCCPSTEGDAVWLRSSTMGTLDPDGEHNLYVEDNTIRNLEGGALDPSANARMVIRHNHFQNAASASHGADSSWIGVRHVELYDNTFTCTASGSGAVLPYWQHIRGGTWVITGNTWDDLANCSYQQAGVLATIQNLQRNSGQYGCWGDGNHPNQHWPAPHQVGQGANGTAQVADPLYIWGNNGSMGSTGNYNQNDYGGDECRPPLASVATYIVAGPPGVGRDVITDAPKPGWTRYAYPHPLRGGGNSGTGPAPPQNVHIVGGG